MTPTTPPTFPMAIGNPFQVVVYLERVAWEAEHYPNGVPMACESIEHAEHMFDVENLTRGFPWWTRALLLERADGGRAAIVLAQRTRDLTVTTWRRPDPSGS